MGQLLDLVSPPWAPTSVLALHLASGLRDPMALCNPRASRSFLLQFGPRPPLQTRPPLALTLLLRWVASSGMMA